MRYIKARRETARFLNLTELRQVFPDGNFLIWDRDIMRICSPAELDERLASFGCREVSVAEARAEFNGEIVTELPDITDTRILSFIEKKIAEEVNRLLEETIEDIAEEESEEEKGGDV